MTIGVATKLTYKGKTYEIPTSSDDRMMFLDDLLTAIEALDGVEEAIHADSTQTMEGVTIEVILDSSRNPRNTAFGENGVTIMTSLRSFAQRMNNTIKNFTPVAHYEVISTPTPIDSSEDAYDQSLYIVDIRFY